MDLDDLQQSIHRMYEGNIDYYTSSEEDYTLRTGYINDAIQKWQQQDGIQWRELFTNLADAADGDKTTTSGDSVLNAPTNFVEISSYVKINDIYYPFLKNDEVLTKLRNTSSDRFFYITGKPGAYKININPAIDTTGLTISYSYYKEATTLSTGTDRPEMSKPLYIVYDVVAQLYELDNRNDLVNKYLQQASGVMNEMIILNETAPEFNEDQIDDLDYKLKAVRIGR